MNDRELLELAAKAAGIEMGGTLYSDGSWSPYTDRPFKPSSGIGGGLDVTGWNPLEDDGDALRLAAKLGLELSCDGRGITAQSILGSRPAAYAAQSEANEDNHMAKLRRAVVTAAAQIGKALEFQNK